MRALIVLLLLCCNPFALSQPAPQLQISHLRTEYKINPLGIDVVQPRFSWELQSADRDVRQAAYQLRCAGSADDLQNGKNILWDTGIIKTDQSNQIAYNGPQLKSTQRVFWQVRVWDQHENESAWSDINQWEMGLLHASDWKASWITPGPGRTDQELQSCPMLRRVFHINGNINRARAYVTSLGLYELSLNGTRVGDQLFTPGWTSYNKRLQYQVYDITSHIKSGENAVGAILGNGWYRGQLGWNSKMNLYGDETALLLQIVVTFEDGSRQMISTDNSWKTSTGPILFSEIYHGEIYDARLEQQGWDASGFDDSDWQPVKILQHEKEMLVASMGPAVRKIEEIKAVNIITTPAGDTVYDMGQNMVGWVRLKVSGPAGTIITLRHSEVLDKNGNMYTENLRSAKQTVQYTLKGVAEEQYEPHFTFQGFRYVAVKGLPAKPVLENITGIVIHSDMTPTGYFSSSNEMINQLQHNIVWGLKGNFLDVPTDCPQRDERMGWTGDAQVFAPTACFLMDAASFYTKWLKDLAADQKEDGSVPWVIPDVLGGAAATGWADAAIIIPWTLYLNYGDLRILQEQYSSMKAWVDFMMEQAGESYIWNSGKHFGDWLAFATTKSDYPGATTDKDLIATAYFYYSTTLLQKIAELLGRDQDARQYLQIIPRIKEAFQKEFLTANGRLSPNTQTAYVLALAFDLIPAELKQTAAQRLADDVKNFGHITTGFLGTPLICQVLSDYGYHDLAYMLLMRKSYPSWLYPLSMGATTIWERWDGIRPDSTFQDKGMNSFNHYAYGAVGKWLYSYVAGIRIDGNKPGYKHILFQPLPGGGLSKADARINTIYGEARSSWEISDGRFIFDITVPANCSATARLPGAQSGDIKETGRLLKNARGIKNYTQDGETVVVHFASGQYRFVYPWPDK